ncbi:MAG: TCR/Tet family MFS transporter [Alphaproteobacteria bacterium]
MSDATSTEDEKPGLTPGMLFVLAIIFIDTVSFGIIIPVMPDLLTDLTGQPVEKAAVEGGILMIAFALTLFLCAPLIGGLSDRFGRRPLMLASMAAFTIDYIIMGLAQSYEMLLIGRVVAGVAGGVYATANAYIADISTHENRARNFGIIGAAWGIGFVTGPAIGGLLGELGPRVPFFVAAGFCALNFVYGYFVVPESLAPENRRPFDIKRANPLGSLLALKRFPMLLGLFGVMALFQVGHDVNPTIWTYYTKYKFGWGPGEIGWSLAIVGITIAVVQSMLTGRLVARFGEYRTAQIGLTLGACGFLAVAFAPSSFWMYCAIPLSGMFALASPTIRAIMANQVGEDQQGELSGALSSLFSLSMLLTPLVMPALFEFFTSAAAPVHFPGIGHFSGAILFVLALLAFIVAGRGKSLNASDG